MRFFNVQSVARPVYYDRNPVIRQLTYSAAAVAPHGVTTRATYTVPVGKKAYLEEIQISTRRDVVATAVGLVQPFIQYFPVASTAANILLLEHLDNTLQIQRQIALSQFGLMATGDVLNLNTADQSTGGSNVYNLVAKLTEFDG